MGANQSVSQICAVKLSKNLAGGVSAGSQNLPCSNYKRITCSCSYYTEHTLAFLANMGTSGPSDPAPDQNQFESISVMWVPKLLLNPIKLGFLAHKQPNLA